MPEQVSVLGVSVDLPPRLGDQALVLKVDPEIPISSLKPGVAFLQTFNSPGETPDFASEPYLEQIVPEIWIRKEGSRGLPALLA